MDRGQAEGQDGPVPADQRLPRPPLLGLRPGGLRPERLLLLADLAAPGQQEQEGRLREADRESFCNTWKNWDGQKLPQQDHMQFHTSNGRSVSSRLRHAWRIRHVLSDRQQQGSQVLLPRKSGMVHIRSETQQGSKPILHRS